MNPDLYYCIPAYNEELNILNCLSSLAEQDFSGNVITWICLNGCNDKTEHLILDNKHKYPQLNINVLHSQRGKAFAQNAIIDRISNLDTPLLFIDADVILEKTCVNILYDELMRNDKLVIIGSWPVPYRPYKMSFYEMLLYNILHLRAFYPESEVSRHDVTDFKQYAYTHPQPRISPSFEVRSKVYFHGRTYLVRNSGFFHLPCDKNVVDDTFLPNKIHTVYGASTIRTRYDAISYYKPYLSIKEHFLAYRRFFLDRSNLDLLYPEFKYTRFFEQTKLDWSYILIRKPFLSPSFLIYAFIRMCEEHSYYFLPKKSVSEIWQYERK